MPRALRDFVRYVDAMSNWLGGILSYGLLFLIAIMLIETVSRYIFNAPTLWSIEMSQFTFGTYVALGGAYVLLRGMHVNMDILSSRWSPRTRAIVNIATFALVAVYLITFIKGGIFSAAFSLQYGLLGHRSKTVWGPPLAPIKIIVIVGAGLLLLQAVAILIRDLATVTGKRI